MNSTSSLACADRLNKLQHKAFLSFRNTILVPFLLKNFKKLMQKQFVCVRTALG